MLQKRTERFHNKGIGNDDVGDMEDGGEMKFGDLEDACEDTDTSDY